MNSFPPAKIRNVALVGHGGSGKTTLTEALLFAAKAIPRLGRVEDGTTTTDFEPEELKRHISASLALAPIEHDGFKINVIDTPGYADFLGDVEAALWVADLAVFVVSAVEGVEVQTEVAWRMAADANLPRLIFVNKLDRERASFERTLAQLQERFGTGVAPLELPLGEETSFRGVADLLSESAFVYESQGGAPPVASATSLPDELAETEHPVRDSLIEGIVVADDELMERYLDGDVPTPKELEETLAKGVATATVFPVLCGSATRGIGVDRLASFVCELGPSPLGRPPTKVRAGDRELEVACDPAGDPLAIVFKTIADPYVGKISLLKVVSGTIRPDTSLLNSRSHSEERLHALFTLRGKEQEQVPEAQAGDLVAVGKLADTATGDTLAPRNQPVTVAAPARTRPMLSIAIRPKSKGDEDKLMTALHRLQDEDLALRVERNDETRQTILSGMGETHLAIAAERLQRKFGVDLETEELIVPYRETITKPAEAEGKYKKQTGGHGQFGVANIKIEPLERGEGFEFVDKIVGGAIPRQFIPAVEKGVAESMVQGGVLKGYPVVDVRVTCYDGKFHSVDSSELSFKMAGSLGFKEAMGNAAPVLLEPISLLEVTVPNAYQGDVMGDLNSRRGRVQGTETASHDEQTIVALVPTSEILRYATELRSLTGGRGRFTVQHDHYDLMPTQLAERVPKRGEN